MNILYDVTLNPQVLGTNQPIEEQLLVRLGVIKAQYVGMTKQSTTKMFERPPSGL